MVSLRPSTFSGFSKWMFLLHLATLILYAVSFASPYWLQADFTLNIPGAVLGLPPPLDGMTVETETSAHVGLLRSCDSTVVKIPMMPEKKTEDCGTDGAKDWQYAAAGCGVAALVLAIISFGLSAVFMVFEKRSFSNKLRGANTLSLFLASLCALVPILLYFSKKEVQVKPPLPDRVDFDLIWAFWMSVASNALFVVLAGFHVIHGSFFDATPRMDPSASYKMEMNS